MTIPIPDHLDVIRGEILNRSDDSDLAPLAERGVGPVSPADLPWFHSRGIPLAWSVDEFGARSISDRSEFPEGLKGFAADGSAIRWDYQPINGAGWSQIRPSNPQPDADGRLRKYVGNSGATTGERLILNRTMKARFNAGAYRRVLLVEGTGQTQVASWVYQDDGDTLVVGTPGCWGWSEAGVAAGEIHDVCKNGVEVIVVFDADVCDNGGRKGNPRVHAAGSRLAATVQGATGSEPRFLMFPAGGDKAGFDDFCAASFLMNDAHGNPVVDAARARQFTDNLIRGDRSCRLLPKTPPKGGTKAVAKPATPALIKWDPADGDPRIVRLERLDSGAIVEGPVFAGFAMRIASTIKVKDHLNSTDTTTLYDVEIAYRDEVRVVRDLTHTMLGDVDGLLNRAGFAFAHWEGTGGGDREAKKFILRALKADAEERGVLTGESAPHTGLIIGEDGRARWATPSGMITAEGHSRTLGRAFFAPGTNESRIDFSIVDDAVTDEQMRDAFANDLRMLDMYSDPTWHIVATGHAAWGVTGLPSEGGIMLVGSHGGGKTQVVGQQTRRWGPHYVAHVLPGQTEANGSDIGQGLEGAWVALDDFKPFTNDPDKRKRGVAILEAVGRRAGDGDDEHSGRATKKASAAAPSGWVNGTSDMARPVIACSGEEFPWELDRSTKQRFLTVQHPHRPLGDNYTEFKKIERSGAPNLAMGLFIVGTCARVDEVGLDAFHDECRRNRKRLADEIMAACRFAKEDERCATVAAGRLAGWYMWLRMAKCAGAITEDEERNRQQQALDIVIAAATEHYRRYLTDEDQSEDQDTALIEALFDLDFQYDSLYYRSRSSLQRAGKHGWVGVVMESGDVAVNPKAVAGALGGTWTMRTVQECLRRISGQANAGVHRVDDKTARCYVVPAARWPASVPDSVSKPDHDFD